MNIYILNVIVVLFANAICKYKIKGLFGHTVEGTKAYNLIVCITFTFITACRSSVVGVDTLPYSRIFGIIANSKSYFDAINNAPLTAPAYVIFCKTLSFFSSDPQIEVFASALIINIGLVLIVSKASEEPSISYLSWIGLTLFYCSMNGSRQCMSLVLAIYSLLYLADNIKCVKALVLFCIAVLIHPTVFILFFAIAGIILANRIADNRMLFFVSSIISILIVFGYGIGVKLILRFVPRYYIYISGEAKYSIFNSTGGGRIILLYLALLGIILLWMLKNKDNKDYERNFAGKMLPATLFCVIFGIANCKNELINRMLWYYLGIFIIFIPTVFTHYSRKERIVLKIIIMGCFMTYSILSLIENQNGVVPYKFFWE